MTPWALTVAGAVAVVFAGLMVLQRSLYLAAICLLAVLLQTAALFFMFGAPLLAFLQIMIYAGAVMVLIVVVIMSAPARAESRFVEGWAGRPLAVAALLIPAAQTAALLFRARLQPGGLGAGLPQPAALGAVLFGPYAAATEAVTLLMFLSALALVGRVSRRGEGA